MERSDVSVCMGKAEGMKGRDFRGKQQAFCEA